MTFPKLTFANSRGNAISVATFSRILLIIKYMAVGQSFEPDFPFWRKDQKGRRREESDNAQLTWRFSLSSISKFDFAKLPQKRHFRRYILSYLIDNKLDGGRTVFRTGLSLLEKGSKGRRREESDNAQLTWRFSLVAFPNLTSQNCRGNATFVATFSRILLIIK